MSSETRKAMDPAQRQQIMASVQQQLALQNAQELLQVERDLSPEEEKKTGRSI